MLKVYEKRRLGSSVLSVAVFICLFFSFLMNAAFAQTVSTVSSEQSNSQVLLPEHLEKISQNDSVESTVFDLYLSDKFRGSLVASYTNEWFEIDDPQEVVRQLPEIIAGQGDVIELVTGRINNRREKNDIGTVSYDLSTFRIIVEVSPHFLKGSSLDLSKRIESPDKGFALQQTIGLAAFTDEKATTQAALTHRGFASNGTAFFRADGAVVQDRPYQLNEASAGDIVGDEQVKGGLVQLRGQTFSPSLQLAGAQVETVEQLYLDDERSRGSKLEVFIPSRSTVQFFRDGQLLAVKVLDFGLQEIDTSAFPQGSYDVDIVITDSFGREQRERRFFTKAGYLASRNAPSVFFSGGTIRNRTEIRGKSIVQGGIRNRVSDEMDLSPSISSTEDETIGSLDAHALYRQVRLGASVAGSRTGGSGGAVSAGTTIEGAGIDLRMVRAHGEDGQPSIPQIVNTPSTPTIIPPQVNPRTDLFIQTQKASSLGAFKTFGKVDLRYNVQRNKVGLDITRYSSGPLMDVRLFESAKEQLTLRGADQTTERGDIRSMQLMYRNRLTPELFLDAQALQRWQKFQDEMLFLFGVTYDSTAGLSGMGSRIQINTEARDRENSESGRHSYTTGIYSDITTEYLRTNTFLRRNTQSGRTSNVAGINAESSFFIANNGEASVARPTQAESALLVEVKGNAINVEDTFEVYVDNQLRDTLVSGQQAVVSLAPYRKYQVSLRPKDNASLVLYDTGNFDVIVFPGNVVKKTWTIDRVFIVIGRLIDEQGNPIPHERILGTKDYTFTESDGTFQCEITGSEALTIRSKRRSCDVVLSIKEKPEFYVDVKDALCREVPGGGGTDASQAHAA